MYRRFPAKEALVTEALREDALAAIAGLARRAMDAGRLRPGFVLDDLLLVLMASGGIRGDGARTPRHASARAVAR